MIAKYPAKCFMCGLPIVVGVDHYDVALKRSSHVLCEIEAEENHEPSQEQFELADRLSFITYRQEMGIDGFLRSVSATCGGLTAWGLGSETHRRQEYTLRSSDQSENISEGRGFQSY